MRAGTMALTLVGVGGLFGPQASGQSRGNGPSQPRLQGPDGKFVPAQEALFVGTPDPLLGLSPSERQTRNARREREKWLARPAWPPTVDKRAAVTETLAHLLDMEEKGIVKIVEANSVAKWARRLGGN